MEFYVQKSKIQDEMGRLSSIVDKKSPIPILENTLIKSDGMRIKFTATDLDLTMYTECMTEQVTGEGALCVPTRKLFDIVKLMPEGVIKLSGDTNQWLKVQAKGSNFKIPGANPDQFPDTPKIPTEWLNVSSKALKLILKGVAFSASTSDDNRYAIGGVKIEIRETDIRMVATDGRRISLSSGPLDELMLSKFDTLLPAKGVGELSRLLSDYDGEVGLAAIHNAVFFKAGTRIIHSRLLEGKFPTYEPAFQTVYPLAATFKADQLSLSLKRTLQVADDELAGITLYFQDGKLGLFSQTPEQGECYEVLDSNFNGGEFSIVCSAKFLLEFLAQMGSNEVRFEVKDAKTPIHLQVVSDGITYRYILIPMRDKSAAKSVT